MKNENHLLELVSNYVSFHVRNFLNDVIVFYKFELRLETSLTFDSILIDVVS